MKHFRSHRAKPLQQKGTAKSAAPAPASVKAGEAASPAGEASPGKVHELGGPDGPEPTRYGDWERKGICYDF